MWHSTGANNPYLRRYVAPDDGLLGQNLYGNHWNTEKPDGQSKCIHAFIGRLENGEIATYQTLPLEINGWHCGGTANNSYIGFELCEDSLADQAYFEAVYKEAIQFSAYLCKQYDLDPLLGNTILDHSTGYQLGLASNHGDVMHWFSRYGVTLSKIRTDIQAEMNDWEEIDMTKDEVQKMIQAEAVKIADARIAAYFSDLTKKSVNAWAKEAWEQATAAGVMDGTMPRSALSREQYALTLQRLGLLEKKA